MCQGQADANQPAIPVVPSNAVRRGPWAQVKLLKLGAMLGLRAEARLESACFVCQPWDKSTDALAIHDLQSGVVTTIAMTIRETSLVS